MFTEVRTELKGFSDLLDYFALVDDGVALLATGTYVAGFEFMGPDMDAMDTADSFGIARRIAERLTMGSGWTIACHTIRSEHLEYTKTEGDWPDKVSWLIEQERKAWFTTKGLAGHRLSRYFLSISYEPAMGTAKRAARWFFASEGEEETSADRRLAEFNAKLTEIQSLFDANLANVRRLGSFTGDEGQQCCEFMQFVRLCISGDGFPFAIPERPVYLNQYLATDDFLGGDEPQLGDPLDKVLPGKHIRILAIDAFPERGFAGILRQLDSVPFDFRFCATGQMLGTQEAADEHKANRERWGARKTSTGAKVMRRQVGAAEMDGVAMELEADAGQAASAAAHGRERSMWFSAKIILMDSDLYRIREAVTQIREVLHRCGFGCRLENLNSVAAWLSTFPGMHKRDVRQCLVSNDNFTHMMPLSAPFRGHEYTESKYFPKFSPPLFYGVTSGGTPYRFSRYVHEDIGHELIVGPIGGGKSIYLLLSAVSFLRFPGSRVVLFDKKRSAYTLGKALGASWYNLSPNSDSASRLCPLQYLETEGQRDRAVQFIEMLVSESGLDVSPNVRNSIKAAIERLAGGRGGRSLTAFCMAVDDEAVAMAMEFYLGGLLDGDHDNLSLSRFTIFEMDELYRLDKKTMNGALFTVFGRLWDGLSSNIPTMVGVDEFREALEHPAAAKAFSELLNEGRKLNLAVSLVLQSLTQALNSPLRTAILESCMTRVFLPNTQATADAAESYKTLELGASDQEIVAGLQPKSEYYIVQPGGKRRKISLEMGQVALAFIAASSDKDRARVDVLAELYPNNWQAQWLRERGLPDWADLLEQVMAKEEEGTYLCASGD